MYTVVYQCKNDCWFITTIDTFCELVCTPITNEWLTIHPIVNLHDSEKHDTAVKAKCFAEARTLEYMAVYGVDKVRGGSHSDIRIDYARLSPALTYVNSPSKKHIDEDSFIDVSLELFCRRCGYNGHLAEVCSAEVGLDGHALGEDDFWSS